MTRRFFAVLLTVLAISPFSAPFSTCALSDLADPAGHPALAWESLVAADDEHILEPGQDVIPREFSTSAHVFLVDVGEFAAVATQVAAIHSAHPLNYPSASTPIVTLRI